MGHNNQHFIFFPKGSERQEVRRMIASSAKWRRQMAGRGTHWRQKLNQRRPNRNRSRKCSVPIAGVCTDEDTLISVRWKLAERMRRSWCQKDWNSKLLTRYEKGLIKKKSFLHVLRSFIFPYQSYVFFGRNKFSSSFQPSIHSINDPMNQTIN